MTAISSAFSVAGYASSGNILADKRFAYADALLQAGDALAAADLFAQAAEQAPGWAPASLAQGLALERAGRRDEALTALQRAAQCDRAGTLGAQLHLARLMGGGGDHMSAAYVATLFDQYAPRFDAHLVGTLGYRGPAVILTALDAAAPGRRFGPTLDLGCGTGLMARTLAGRAAPIDGIDLSPGMIARADATGLYRALRTGDCTAEVERLAAGGYELAVAADVLVYLGDLAPLFTAASRALASGGIFAATLEAGEADFAIGPDLRFRHGLDYVRRVLLEADFTHIDLAPCVTRQDGGRDVPGLVFTAART